MAKARVSSKDDLEDGYLTKGDVDQIEADSRGMAELGVDPDEYQQRMNELYMTQIAAVREAILEEQSPRQIAEWLATHFDEYPDDILDTAMALVQQYIGQGISFSREQAQEWADKAFGV
jgi:hypothetical protein